MRNACVWALLAGVSLAVTGCSAVTDFSRRADGGSNNQNNQNNQNTNTNGNTNTNTGEEAFGIDVSPQSVDRRVGVASSPSGLWMVAWASINGTSGNTITIHGRIYDDQGAPTTEQLMLWDEPIALLDDITVSWSGNDRVLVAWTGTALNDTNHTEARAFDAEGTARAGPVRLNEDGITYRVASTTALGGDVFVIWNKQGTGYHELEGRFVDPDSGDLDVLVSITPLSESSLPEAPALAAMADGTYFVAWAQGGGPGDDLNIVAKQLDEYGAGTSVVFDVHDDDPGDQRSPALGNLGDNRFVVAWVDEPQDGDNTLWGRVFDGADSPTREAFHITDTMSGNVDPFDDGIGLATSEAGRFLVTWHHQREDDRHAIHYRGFGTPQSGGGVIHYLDGPAEEGMTSSRAAALGEELSGFVAVWRRQRAPGVTTLDLYGSLLDTSFAPVSPP